ncbi:MAG: butyrate kinase [Spirochaetia bacterium]
MEKTYRVLVINPGSTSTKVAVFDNEVPILEQTLRHATKELDKYERISDQFGLRKQVILDELAADNISVKSLSCVVGRGGLIHPVSGGTYEVNEHMISDLQVGVLGEHASNLGGILAHEIAAETGIPSYIVDPVVVDELDEVARPSGIPDFDRTSIFHALNQKAVARRFAANQGKSYDELNLVIVHLGGGITVGAHRRGRVVDVNDGLNGEGPFTPERSGGLPALKLAKLCYSGEFSHSEMKKKIKGGGGLVAYLGTNDGREVAQKIDDGDETARLVYEAMAYQTAKEVGAMAAVLEGSVDAIILTGGLAHDERFCEWVKKRVAFLAPVEVYPGEDEMKALAEGAIRVLSGAEPALEYQGAAATTSTTVTQ